ncbi:hypothetical protein V1509DRAFT_203827 [Lipomyces kononenkoae]
MIMEKRQGGSLIDLSDNDMYFVRLSSVQRHARLIPAELRDPMLKYFKAKMFFSFGWDVFVGRVGSTAKPDLFVANNQVDYFLSEVERRGGIKIDPIEDEGKVDPKMVRGLKHLVKTTDSAQFHEKASKEGLKYDSSPRVLWNQEQRQRKKEIEAAKKAEKREVARERALEMERLVRQSIDDKKMVFVSVDIEVYELNHNCVTEIGVAVLDLRQGNTKDAKPVGRHLRVKEYMHLKNGKFVDDASEKFEFGTSEILTLKQCAKEMKKIFDEYGDLAMFVGHDGANDVRYLRQLGIELPEEMATVDTLTLWQIHHGEDEQSSLGRLLMEYDIKSWNLHNAGNDAYYTVQVLMAMYAGDVGKE